MFVMHKVTAFVQYKYVYLCINVAKKKGRKRELERDRRERKREREREREREPADVWVDREIGRQRVRESVENSLMARLSLLIE